MAKQASRTPRYGFESTDLGQAYSHVRKSILLAKKATIDEVNEYTLIGNGPGIAAAAEILPSSVHEPEFLGLLVGAQSMVLKEQPNPPRGPALWGRTAFSKFKYSVMRLSNGNAELFTFRSTVSPINPAVFPHPAGYIEMTQLSTSNPETDSTEVKALMRVCPNTSHDLMTQIGNTFTYMSAEEMDELGELRDRYRAENDNLADFLIPFIDPEFLLEGGSSSNPPSAAGRDLATILSEHKQGLEFERDLGTLATLPFEVLDFVQDVRTAFTPAA